MGSRCEEEVLLLKIVEFIWITIKFKGNFHICHKYAWTRVKFTKLRNKFIWVSYTRQDVYTSKDPPRRTKDCEQIIMTKRMIISATPVGLETPPTKPNKPGLLVSSQSVSV